MQANSSLTIRVAWGAALAASLSALIAACATSALTAYLLQVADDRRLEEAAVTFAYELDRVPPDFESILGIYTHESQEMEHTGILFAVYDTAGKLLKGDQRLACPTSNECVTHDNGLRVCGMRSKRGLFAVTASLHTTLIPQLAGAAVVAAVLAALLALLASRPISRRVIAPLSRLRERIANLDIDAISSELVHSEIAKSSATSALLPRSSEALLGPMEHIVEVDALRSTIHQLVQQVERALAQAQRFAANAAHELRTPLTSVLAELELLSERVTDDDVRLDVLRARRSLADLSILVERLLILSVPRRTLNDTHEVVSLRDIVEDTLTLQYPSEQHRVTVSDTDVMIAGDSVLLGTMVANALSNALKFGIRVTTHVTARDGWAVLHVDDDGPGINTADQDHVFEPFFRSPSTLRRRLPGHGLGLALVRHIAQMHGGSATFVPRNGPGARLEIRLVARVNG